MYITKYRKVKLMKSVPYPDKCPLCGEEKRFVSGESGGVEGFKHIWFRRRITRLWDLYKYSIIKYRCHSCDAEWHSKIEKEIVDETIDM